MKKERTSLLFGGLAGFISVAFIQLLTMDINSLDLSLNIAVACFSLVLPMTVFYFISAQTHLRTAKTKVPVWYENIAAFTILVGFIGISALFNHFSSVLAIIFTVISVVAVFISNKLDANKRFYFPSVYSNTKEKKRTLLDKEDKGSQ